jgi:hypothetical protein
MSKRKSAAASAVEFFQTAALDTAREVLAICVNTVKQRGGAETTKRAPRAPRTAATAASVGGGES